MSKRARGSIRITLSAFLSIEIKETEDILMDYVATIIFREKMRNYIMSAAGQSTQHLFVRLDLQGPETGGEEGAIGKRQSGVMAPDLVQEERYEKAVQ
jgi:hypothetical protein